jgi:3-keto-5-aminohexanoate cleavage enzyme
VFVGDGIVITAAIVGAEVMREDSPYIPYSAQELAEEARRCVAAGASIIHLHVRNPDGSPSQAEPLFRAAIRAIREKTDAIVQVSTGGAVGMSLEERLGGLGAGAEMATLSCGSVNFGDGVFINSMPEMREVARRIRRHGLLPELEIFDAGHLDNAQRLIAEGAVGANSFLQFVLGVEGAIGARKSVLRFLLQELPRGAHWSVAAIGRHEFPMIAFAMELGGHARVGLEDNLYLERGVLAKGSAPLVEKAVQLARERGREPLSVRRVRALIERAHAA